MEWIARYRVLTAAAGLMLLAAACTGGDEAKKPGEQVDAAQESAAAAKNENRVLIKTNKGMIEVELYPDKAPKTVENFLAYIDAGFYDGTIFHRVIEDFMIQGGGYDTAKERKETREPIPNEANNGLKNETGSVAMARTSAPHSATSQFFVNVKDNKFLDFQSETPQGWGYAVFGSVVDGMDIVRTIEKTPTSDQGGAFRDMPEEEVVIEAITRK